MSSQQTVASKPWVKYLLIASLALNVMVVGAIGGLVLRGAGGWQRGGGQNLFGFMSQLPRERRESLQRRARDLRPAIRDLRETVRTAGQERSAALLADPFDRQRYISAQTRQIEADSKLRLLIRDAVADAAAEMTVSERRAFVNWRGQRRLHGPSDRSIEDLPPKQP